MQLEEERRLFFVGMTRAEEELRLSRTQYREFRGSYNVSILSRFLMELPQDEILRCESPDDVPDEHALRDMMQYGLPNDGASLHIDPEYNDTEVDGDVHFDDYYIDEEYEELPTVMVDDDVVLREQKRKRAEELKLHLTTAAELYRASDRLQASDSGLQEEKSDTNLNVQNPKPEARSPKPEKKPKRPKYKVGMPVQHRDYGFGVVLSVTGGNEKTVTVDFEETVGPLQLPLPCKLLKPLEQGLDEIF
jgi:ATP-dependent exoDNAse (exonuclease V) beta subunit